MAFYYESDSDDDQMVASLSRPFMVGNQLVDEICVDDRSSPRIYGQRYVGLFYLNRNGRVPFKIGGEKFFLPTVFIIDSDELDHDPRFGGQVHGDLHKFLFPKAQILPKEREVYGLTVTGFSIQENGRYVFTSRTANHLPGGGCPREQQNAIKDFVEYFLAEKY